MCLAGRTTSDEPRRKAGGQQGESAREKGDFPIWSASALEGRNSFGSRQVTQVAIPASRQIDALVHGRGRWSLWPAAPNSPPCWTPPPPRRTHHRGRTSTACAAALGVQFNIVYLITAGLVGILVRLWASRCGIGWSLPQQILACWPATNNTRPLPREGVGDAVHAYRQNKETFCSPGLACVRTTNQQLGSGHARGSSQHPVLPTSGNRRRDSQVRLAAAEAAFVCT